MTARCLFLEVESVFFVANSTHFFDNPGWAVPTFSVGARVAGDQLRGENAIRRDDAARAALRWS